MENTAVDVKGEIEYVEKMDAAEVETPLINHIIGQARTIQTAVLVVEYLKKRIPFGCKIHADQIRYRFTNPTPDNGYWSADIIVENHSFGFDGDELIGICHAFVAGRGEIWA